MHKINLKYLRFIWIKQNLNNFINRNTFYFKQIKYYLKLTRCSNAICEFGGSPTQARRIFSMAARCRNSELTTGAPLGTRGALHK